MCPISQVALFEVIYFNPELKAYAQDSRISRFSNY